MSVYQMNKACFDLKREENRAAFRADPDGYLARYDLSEDERQAFAEEDYLKLFELGCNIYVLVVYAHLKGLKLGDLIPRMRQEA
jgi:protocatechuate 4,5-dioxygenase alpha chain